MTEVAATESLKLAAPASDISRVNAVIVLPPSLPLTIKSLFKTPVVTTKLLAVFEKV